MTKKSEPMPAQVSTKPGGLGFTLGRGWGQWALFAALGGVTIVCLTQGARAAALALVAVAFVAALLRAVLPARWVPALVNRGRFFDVAMATVFATLLLLIVESGPRL